MFVPLRFTAIALCVVVLALFLAVCVEAGACGGCFHACCVRTERPTRRDSGLLARILKACDSLASAVRPGVVTAMVASPLKASGPPVALLLATKVDQLRI